jgi:hypothetical protein
MPQTLLLTVEIVCIGCLVVPVIIHLERRRRDEKITTIPRAHQEEGGSSINCFVVHEISRHIFICHHTEVNIFLDLCLRGELNVLEIVILFD